MKKIILVGLLVALVIIQFFKIDTSNPPINKGMDFLSIKNTPPELAQLIKTSCYDCHSNESKYPWYAKVQPTAWILEDHIKEGRTELNFSTFATYEPKRQIHKLEESAEQIEQGDMPLETYILLHPAAKLTDTQKKSLFKYFRQVAMDIRTANLIDYQVPDHD